MSCQHRAINPRGQEIILPMFVIDALSSLHCTYRPNGIPHISERVYRVVHMLEAYDDGPKPLRAVDYRRYMGGRSPRNGGRANRFLSALGPDISGVGTWLDCRCASCQRTEEDADRTAMPFG